MFYKVSNVNQKQVLSGPQPLRPEVHDGFAKKDGSVLYPPVLPPGFEALPRLTGDSSDVNSPGIFRPVIDNSINDRPKMGLDGLLIYHRNHEECRYSWVARVQGKKRRLYLGVDGCLWYMAGPEQPDHVCGDITIRQVVVISQPNVVAFVSAFFVPGDREDFLQRNNFWGVK